MNHNLTYGVRLIIISALISLLTNIGPFADFHIKLLGSIPFFIVNYPTKLRKELTHDFQILLNFPDLYSQLAEKERQNMVLQSELTNLKEEIFRLNVLEKELEYKKSLRADFTLVEANVIFESYYPTGEYVFTIDKGSLSGVSVGDVVSVTNYLVGTVNKVTSSTAQVQAILDKSFAAICVDSSQKERIEGSCVSNSSNGVVFTNILPGVSLALNDTIITLGKDGKYPKGLIIGTVVKVEGEINDLNRRAHIKTGFANIPEIVFVEVKK